ncbi:unnamed protein product [Moneuplotes crassus]|uniref:Uncharacterized protein n=1 Tax=Euplotes crassus TaxID=5936 RepID=A0AAD2D1Q9_EUPCR|nr:unnamed protein product [Moneuplotes crassus]
MDRILHLTIFLLFLLTNLCLSFCGTPELKTFEVSGLSSILKLFCKLKFPTRLTQALL